MNDLGEDEIDHGDLDDRFDAVEDEFLKFEDIPAEDRLNPDSKLCGLLYLQKLLRDDAPTWMISGATHDAVYCRCPGELKARLTDDDILYLTRCGILYESDRDVFYFFA